MRTCLRPAKATAPQAAPAGGEGSRVAPLRARRGGAGVRRLPQPTAPSVFLPPGEAVSDSDPRPRDKPQRIRDERCYPELVKSLTPTVTLPAAREQISRKEK